MSFAPATVGGWMSLGAHSPKWNKTIVYLAMSGYETGIKEPPMSRGTKEQICSKRAKTTERFFISTETYQSDF